MSGSRVLAARVLSLLALALAWVAVVTPSRAGETGNVFEGCEVTGSEHGELIIKCPGLFASVSTGGLTAEAGLQSALNGVRAAFKGPVIQQRTETSLRGVQRPSISFSAFAKADDKAPVARGVFVAFPLADGATLRVIGCVAMTAAPGAAKRCDAVLQSMAQSLPAPTAISGPSEYGASGTGLLGRALPVPQGCSLPQPGRLECEAAILSWRHVPSSLDLAMVLGPLRTEYAKGGKTQESVVQCQIEGAPRQCYVFTVKLGDNDTLYSMLGLGSGDQQGVLVQCDSVRPLIADLPAPCDQVFSLR